MKSKTLCLILLTCFFMTGIAVKSSYAKKNACGKEMTAEEMAERAMDAIEIANVMGYHQQYGAPGGSHAKEIELIWAQKTPGVSFASNRGVYQGDIEVIKKYYAPSTGGAMQEPAPGNSSTRTITTPIIEVAGDGKTAKAYWYTIGWSIGIRDGEGSSSWSMEKYGIDFIKEDGKWKIWHFHVYNDWGVQMGKDVAQEAIEQAKNKEEMPPRSPQEDLAPYFKDTVFNEAYSPTRPPNPLNPRLPEPYCTFSDTFSYAEE